MRQVIVSTIGTSLLTNNASNDLRKLLTRTANCREEDINAEDLEAVRLRVDEIGKQLLQVPLEEVRRMSAELNTMIALDSTGSDFDHYLLHTDTFQGEATSRLVADWLRQRSCTVIPQVLAGLSTASHEAFAKGIDSLLLWCDQTLPALRESGHRIIFNLSASFKSLQAYANTLGMFYADEIVYLFEGKDAGLIRIPRLPVAWDTRSLEEHASEVARLAQGCILSHKNLQELPEAYLLIDENDDACLSDWGNIAWNLQRKRILSQELLPQPGLIFTEAFKRDYERRKDAAERTALQEALAKASMLWEQGGLKALRNDPGLLYENYANQQGIGHFRINIDFRVSCERSDESLRLRHFGPHNYVNDNP